MAVSNIYHINDSNFDKVTMRSKVPVLIDFYADWCGPCRTLSAIMEKVAAKYNEQIIFCKMNVDDSPRTPDRYKINAIPTVIIFKDGLAAEKIVGLHDADFYSEVLDRLLNDANEEKESDDVLSGLVEDTADGTDVVDGISEEN